jgi:hypothetical protein
MKKLKLELDELQVESFQTERGMVQRGTVKGNAPPTSFCTEYIDCTWDFGCETQLASCEGTCNTCAGGSCEGTCGGSCYGTCDASCNTCGYSCYESDCACTIQWSACGVYACP